MRIYHWQSERGNFGDDLNLFLWPDLAPDLFADPNDGVLFVGVGSVLMATLPKARLRVVMGTGAGYAPLPRDVGGPGWRVEAVRGPLTARLLGRPELATVDPAVLLPLLPRFQVQAGTETLFIPHWTTAEDPRWRAAAERAGLTYLDPRDDAETVIARIAAASEVVAESLHGAIVADAFRKPWTPVVCTHYLPFKWYDWALSLNMRYEPIRVGADLHTVAKMLARRREARGHDAMVEAEFQRFRDTAAGNSAGGGTGPTAPKPTSEGRLRTMLASLNRSVPDKVFIALAARGLARAARAERRLSSDGVLRDRRNALLGKLDALRRDHAEGRLGSAVL